MGSQRITIRVSEDMGTRLREQSRMKGRSPSELVRMALQNYLGERKGRRSAYELAGKAGLIGCIRGAPKDLSANRRHLEGFGRGK
jgi:metal-responsive CopG/Arc/MetJ family transcriptional regulator